MSEPKIYVGAGKKAGQYDIINISVCLTDLPKEHIFEYEGKKYIKLTVAARKQPDKYGKTHSVSVDTFKPEAQKTPETNPMEQGSDADDLPF